jgi:hypothetical protein
MKSKINNNDLSHWFLRDHATLPAAYVKSCQEFFNSISHKQQAKSYKLQAPVNLHMPGRRVKNRFKRKI